MRFSRMMKYFSCILSFIYFSTLFPKLVHKQSNELQYSLYKRYDKDITVKNVWIA